MYHHYSPPTNINSDNLAASINSGSSTYSPANTDAPIITLDGNVLVSLDVGSTYTEAGALAKDSIEAKLRL